VRPQPFANPINTSSDDKSKSSLNNGNSKTQVQPNDRMMTQLGIRSIPVKVNLDRVNLNDDSFLNDMELELPDFESSFESQDNEADKLKKLGNNLNHINVEINKGSTVEGDKGLLKHVEQNDIDLKRKVANNKINSELNYTNDIHLLDYRPEDESGNVDQSQSNSL